MKLANPGNRHAFANRLDQDVLNASLQAEKRIPQFDAPVWSADLARARQYVAILTKQLSALRTGLNHHLQLEAEIQTLDQHYDSPLELPNTIALCSTVLRQAKKAVAEIVASSIERRDQELQRRIKELEQSANLHDRDVATVLRRLKRAESLQQLFKKLRYERRRSHTARSHPPRNPTPSRGRSKSMHKMETDRSSNRDSHFATRSQSATLRSSERYSLHSLTTC